MAFDVMVEANSAQKYRRAFLLWPKQWHNYRSLVELTWYYIPFQKRNLRELPALPGVYAFVVCPSLEDLHDCSYLMYIGKTDQSLRERCSKYFQELGDPKGRPQIRRMLKTWPDNIYLYFAALPTNGPSACEVEEELLKAFIPPCNTSFPGLLRGVVELVYRS